MLPKKSVELWLSGRVLQEDLWTFLEGSSVLQEWGRERQGFPFPLCLSPGSHLSSPALGSFLCLLHLVRVIAFSSPTVTFNPHLCWPGMETKRNGFAHFCKTLRARVGGAGKKPAIGDHVGTGAGPGDAHEAVRALSSHTSSAQLLSGPWFNKYIGECFLSHHCTGIC